MISKEAESLFMMVMSAGLRGKGIDGESFLDGKTEEKRMVLYRDLLWLSQIHKVLPIVYEGLHLSGLLEGLPLELKYRTKMTAMSVTASQMQRTDRLLKLLERLKGEELRPVILKGLVCRNCYPSPDARESADEDLLTIDSSFERYMELFRSYGMEIPEREQERERVEFLNEVNFDDADGVLTIGLHKSFFDECYIGLKNPFVDAEKRIVTIQIEGHEVRTLAPTDHILFLILHAMKHFIKSGCGIRMVTDVLMMSERDHDQIDWNQVYQGCCETNAEVFAATFFKIGELYFDFDAKSCGLTLEWLNLMNRIPNPEEMLEDILLAGVYGKSNEVRQSSSTVTFTEFQMRNENKNGKPSDFVKNSGNKKIERFCLVFFPTVDTLKSRFLYLEKYPFLLPVAWIQRFFSYGFRTYVGKKDRNVKDILALGNERIRIMEKYGILK